MSGGRFRPGVSGNPKGRPAGSRNRLSEDFIQALCEDFAKYGTEVIERVRVESPADYLKTIAKLVPKELSIEATGGPFSSWSDDELNVLLAACRQQLKEHGGVEGRLLADTMAMRNGGTH